MSTRFVHEGAPVLLEESHALPLVDFVVALRGGALLDPVGQEGLTRMMARLLRRGVRGQPAAEVDQALALLGGRLSVTIARSSIRLHGSVLARNLEPFVALVARLVREPALRTGDLARAKRRIADELRAVRDDDGALADRHLRRLLFGDHPYGLPVGGTLASIRAIRRDDVVAQHARAVHRGAFVFGAAGAVTQDELARLLSAHFADLPTRGRERLTVPAPKIAKGRRVLIVDKKGRSQTQLGMATLGIKAKDPHYFPFAVADAAFGGMFTSRLMQEVRAKRGWSYGASSQIGVGTQREAWRVFSHPSVENAHACAALELELMERYVAEGPTVAELRRAKRFLAGSRCFEEDTAAHRLDLRLSAELFGVGDDHLARYRRSIRAVTREDAQRALQARLKPRDLAIVAVGAADVLGPALGALPGVTEVRTVAFDAPI